MMPVAARHMVPVELLAASISITIAMIAAFGQGPLWAVLQAFPPWQGIPQNVWWAIAYVVPGVALIVAGLEELAHGRGWKRQRIMLWADIRCVAALMLTVTHLSLAGAIFVTGVWILWGVTTVALLLAGFLGWAAFVTRRLSVCLDPKKSTPGLDILIRDSWM